MRQPAQSLPTQEAVSLSSRKGVCFSSTSIQSIDGKCITTKRPVANGQEQVDVDGDGELKSVHVNGVALDKTNYKAAAENKTHAGPHAACLRQKKPRTRHMSASGDMLPAEKSRPQPQEGSSIRPARESELQAPYESYLGVESHAGRSELHAGRKQLHTRLGLAPRYADHKELPAGKKELHTRRPKAEFSWLESTARSEELTPGCNELHADWKSLPQSGRRLLLDGTTWQPNTSQVPAGTKKVQEQCFGTACLTRVMLLVGENQLPSVTRTFPKGTNCRQGGKRQLLGGTKPLPRRPNQPPGRAGQLQGGTAPLLGKRSWLQDGTRWVWDGMNRLPSGTSQLLDAISQLQGGMNQLPCRMSRLPDIISQPQGETNQLPDRSSLEVSSSDSSCSHNQFHAREGRML